MRNIVLVGFMGVGKTSVAEELAKMLGRPIVDTDDLIEQIAGTSISQIFAEHGEEHFRDLESEAVAQIAQKHGLIISTGGGVVLRKANLEGLKGTGVVFCLTAPPEEIWRRVSHEPHRPLLQTEKPLQRIRELLEYRLPYYAQADIVIDTVGRTSAQVAAEVIQLYDETEQVS